ncbi:hypothetical protein LH991_08785 [Schleiferilactobacillus harbinensis]|uniref:hypothetical protein n=1 Tax=Schleiferilactobacillus harbinensis TaxID=304207 RepID=UPI001265D754|nr:hypothetical protein [Schleiferilactobacillus harbinensis]QFR64063.1 hypothetical protein LH991_08785 [Schleiferilactobacillus harbinensis]
MTDKMSKEEARSVLNEFLSRNHLELVANVKAYVLNIVDAIEPEHKKVVLPKAVGEQWDKLVANQPSNSEGSSVDYALLDLVNKANDTNDNAGFRQLSDWWGRIPDSYRKLIDAARYGWVPKSDKLYRVKVYGIDLPALFYWKRDDGTLSFVQGGAGQPETEFTMDEIKQWHLENCEREEVIDDEQ